MSREKKQTRDHFRQAVLARDGHRCVACLAYEKTVTTKRLVAHHITDRNDAPNGGYVAENGISLCEKCHRKAEIFHETEGGLYEKGFLPADLYALIGSSLAKATEASRTSASRPRR